MLSLDPRYYQIFALSSILVFGLLKNRLDTNLYNISFILISIIAAQFTATKIWKLPKFDPKSALISGLSICILFRSTSILVILFVVLVTIFSKFIFTKDKNHIFNPTNFGIAAGLLLFENSWISPGQWGSEIFFMLAIFLVGSFVVIKALRHDITLYFIAIFSFMLFKRAFQLGDPIEIPIHQLTAGSLIIFAFFMISDPKTTPHTSIGRFIMAYSVAYLAYYFRFSLYDPNGIIYSLVIVSAFVPLIKYYEIN